MFELITPELISLRLQWTQLLTQQNQAEAWSKL
jgi:hypothetical protein